MTSKPSSSPVHRQGWPRMASRGRPRMRAKAALLGQRVAGGVAAAMKTPLTLDSMARSRSAMARLSAWM